MAAVTYKRVACAAVAVHRFVPGVDSSETMRAD